MTELLVIGYGNTLRRDDAAGPMVANAIAELAIPGVQAAAWPLLAPELAQPVAEAQRVIFVDASVEAPREVTLRPLEPAESSQIMAHAADPRTVLALARDVFGRAPEAWLLTIPAEDLAIGEGFSELARQGVERAIAEIRRAATAPAPGSGTKAACVPRALRG